MVCCYIETTRWPRQRVTGERPYESTPTVGTALLLCKRSARHDTSNKRLISVVCPAGASDRGLLQH